MERSLFEESINAFHKDRSIREKEFALKENDFKDVVSDLETKLKER